MTRSLSLLISNSNTVANADSKFGVTVAGNNSWDGGTRSNSTASGITTGSGIDLIDNFADITTRQLLFRQQVL